MSSDFIQLLVLIGFSSLCIHAIVSRICDCFEHIAMIKNTNKEVLEWFKNEEE